MSSRSVVGSIDDVADDDHVPVAELQDDIRKWQEGVVALDELFKMAGAAVAHSMYPKFSSGTDPVLYLVTTSDTCDRLVGLVVRRPPREWKIPGSNPACAGFFFSGSSHTSDLKITTPVATLPDAWRYRVSAGTGRPGVSIL